MLLIGLWYHSSKPSFSTYMIPIAHRLRKLYEDGLEVAVPRDFDQEGNIAHSATMADDTTPFKKIIKAVLITGTLDNPARDMVLNKCGHGAKNGCFCKEIGWKIRSSFPFFSFFSFFFFPCDFFVIVLIFQPSSRKDCGEQSKKEFNCCSPLPRRRGPTHRCGVQGSCQTGSWNQGRCSRI